MGKKSIAVVAIVAAVAVAAVSMRSANRADAASGDCYTEAQGPSTPTICS